MIELLRYSRAMDVPPAFWNALASTEAVGLELNHLRAVEESGINAIRPHYVLALSDGDAVGIAYCFCMDLDIAEMADRYPPWALNAVREWNPSFMMARVLEVGHIASIGCTIEAIPSAESAFVSALAPEFDRIALEEGADFCLMRDVPLERAGIFETFLEAGYKDIEGFPIARMKIGWNSLDGYFGALKSKKRNEFRRRRAKLEADGIRVEMIADYAPYAERLAELWTNVAKRNNGYAHERLTPEYFRSMARRLPGRSHVVAITLRGEIVAYGLNLAGDGEYFGVAEGMDYRFRDEYELYANNMFEAVRMACESGSRSLNLGITAYDFKTSMGATLDRCKYYVKAMKDPSHTPAYAKIVSGVVKDAHRAHRAFRSGDGPVPGAATPANAGTEPALPDQAAGIGDMAVSLKPPRKDPFGKLYDYTRADEARIADLYSYFPRFSGAQGPVIDHGGREVIMLGTNSYLGLSAHPAVLSAMHDAVDRYGSGCSGSPLLNGTLDLHSKLAQRLASFAGKDDAILYSTGYQANLGAISTLAGRGDVIVMDRRNHASIVDGALLSGAKLARYEHGDMGSLERVLAKHSDSPTLVVTDSVFSMEGTVVDLPALVGLCARYGARLMLDESHAIGVFGANGRGVAEHFGLTDSVDVIMGTFSKSLASVGGFIAGERRVIDALRHLSRGHVFSASLPPSAVAATLAALDVIAEEPWRRDRLRANAEYLRLGLGNLGFEVGRGGGAIVPVRCGHEILALAAFDRLFKEGVFVNPVLSPAVPMGHEMLRLSVMATHDTETLDRALGVFSRLRTSSWPSRETNSIIIEEKRAI